MLIKIVTKSKINLYTLNCPTGPYQPKCKIMFNKNSPKKDFIRRTLQIQGQGYEKKKKKKKNWHRLFLRSHTLNKVIYPKQYKKTCAFAVFGQIGLSGQ